MFIRKEIKIQSLLLLLLLISITIQVKASCPFSISGINKWDEIKLSEEFYRHQQQNQDNQQQNQDNQQQQQQQWNYQIIQSMKNIYTHNELVYFYNLVSNDYVFSVSIFDKEEGLYAHILLMKE